MSEEYFYWKSGENVQFTKNFNSKEFECPGSKDHKISKKLLKKLQELRDMYGKSIKITSGYRSQAYNDSLKNSVKNSQHVLGLAVDLTGSDLDKLYELSKQLFSAVGDGRKKGKFLHVDVRNLGKIKGPILFGY